MTFVTFLNDLPHKRNIIGTCVSNKVVSTDAHRYNQSEHVIIRTFNSRTDCNPFKESFISQILELKLHFFKLYTNKFLQKLISKVLVWITISGYDNTSLTKYFI